MKKFFFVLTAVLFSAVTFAQAKLETKKYMVSDLCEKTMEIVLTGNDTLDTALRDRIQDLWHISSFEFCTKAQWEERKKSDEFYFMILEEGDRNEGKSGIRYLSVFKGNDKAGKGVEGLNKIATVPFIGVGSPAGKAEAFLPALASILQSHISFILSREFNIGSIVRVNPSESMKKWGKPVIVSRNDLADTTLTAYDTGKVIVSDDEHVSSVMKSMDDECLAGYSICSPDEGNGSVCWTMVIDPQSCELLYLRKRMAGKGSPAGFTYSQLKELARRQ